MGHIVNPEREYRLLQQQLDRKIQGAPDSPALMKILSLLYSPEEANIARLIPNRPTSLNVLSRKLNIPAHDLDDRMTEMARRGVVLDIEHKGRRYFMLPPVIIGLFEFTFMRARPDMPMAELSRLFEEYFTESDRFARTLFQGKTQMFRSFVREEAIPEHEHTEILDWERASHIVTSALSIGVGLCQCHHMATHLGKACDRPQVVCLSFNHGAQTMVRNGYARAITTAEAMKVLETCKEAGLAQTGDNVRQRVTFICNCCGCCCHLMQGMKTFNLHHGVVTSNWIMEVDLASCKGCGKCVAACPVDAIEIIEKVEGGKKRKFAVRDGSICLGCGVCYSACKFGGAKMKPRPKRVLTPETAFDQLVSMAVERGKLSSLIFDDPQKLSHRALARIITVLEKSPPFKAAMAIAPLKSTFLNMMVKGAKKKNKKMKDLIS